MPPEKTLNPFTIRISERVEKDLDDWIEQGLFQTRAEAMREALNLLSTAIEAKRKGMEVVAVDPKTLAELRVAWRIT